MAEKCKCVTAAFTYADGTRELYHMAMGKRTFSGEAGADRVIKALEDIRENCGIDIEDVTIESAKSIKEIFKDKKVWEHLTVEEVDQIVHNLSVIEEDVMTRLRECAEKK